MCTFICKIKSNFIIIPLVILGTLLIRPGLPWTRGVLTALLLWALVNPPLARFGALKAHTCVSLSSFSWVLLVLAIFITLLIVTLSYFRLEHNSAQILLMVKLLLSFLIFLFSSSQLFNFYLTFELSLIPIF